MFVLHQFLKLPVSNQLIVQNVRSVSQRALLLTVKQRLRSELLKSLAILVEGLASEEPLKRGGMPSR